MGDKEFNKVCYGLKPEQGVNFGVLAVTGSGEVSSAGCGPEWSLPRLGCIFRTTQEARLGTGIWQCCLWVSGVTVHANG